MQHAEKQADFLLDQGMQLLAQPSRDDVPQSLASSSVWPLLVYNALSWQRDDLVTVAAPATGMKVVAIRRTGSHQLIPFDIDEQGRAVFVAHDLPSLGYAMFQLETTPGQMVSTLRDVPVSSQAENKNFSLRFRS